MKRTRNSEAITPPVWKPTAEDLRAAYDRTITDVIARGLDVLFVGINPSLYSAAVGHHFARPGNRFWPTLHRSGFTPRLLSPFEDGDLPKFGCGVTNITARATARADELTADELTAGAKLLNAKVKKYRPACVAFLGVTAYRVGYGEPRARVGVQPDRIGKSLLWVLPNPSGLNAHYQIADLAALYAEVRAAVARQPGSS